ncbi:choice-of-anchor Q domain-containing protein [Chroococcus sp. FPU101]|uniref:choice-of-anchor Q domain-containing protein n=1 Tax=Chroococcus sp. FPU101 TaxID=1974212 RepID=UPI001A8DFAD9|nr:choice-of-anchor Q domain-containing protein [Chroococcus sp. FPU101]GFE69532.1 hypothetical protein CFPU101_21420 [Chroococcus sp. FPU101]
MATFTVTNLSDSGLGSLRQAIENANNRPGLDTVEFANFPGNNTINLSTGELSITDSVTINGLGLTINGNNQEFRIFKINPSTSSSINVSINGLTITGGKPSGEGGGIYSNFTNLTLTDSIITGNTVNGSQSDDFDGGGVYSKNGSLTISNSIISGNTCLGDTPDGGGIYSIDGTLKVINSTITDNRVDGLRFDGGGGIYSARGSVTVINSTISNNSTFADSRYDSADGGGIFIRAGNLNVANSTISGNVASGARTDGGGIYSRDSRVNVINSTISDNLTSVRGGGIFSIRGRLTVANSTISDNGAVNGGGIFNDSTFNLSNTIIANSLAGGDCITSGSLATNSNNLIEDGSCQPAISGDPKLGPLQDNGGPTFTQALLFDSPALDAGNNAIIPSDVNDLDGDGNITEPLPNDQRGTGYARIVGSTVDIGAFEAQNQIPQLSINDVTVIDDPEGLTNAVFTVTLSNPSSTTVTVRYSSANETAIASVDYTPVSRTLTIGQGQNTATITVSITADTLVEAPETFVLNLSSANHAIINDAQGVGTITNLDPVQYGASYGDLIQNLGDNLDALRQHYYTIGRFEGRQSDLFDEFRYIASNPDLIPVFGTDGARATEHYIRFGFSEQRSLTAFDPARYLDSYDDLLGVYGTNLEAATQHYLTNGFYEQRNPNLFSSARYLASYGDLIEAFGYNLASGSTHYLNLGRIEGRQITFEPTAYLERNPDVFAAYGNDVEAATKHYIEYGYYEQRLIA